MELLVNGKRRTVEDIRTVSDLLEDMELDPDQVAVEVDESVVPGGDYEEFTLNPGAEVEIVTFVGGG
jgi:thiamine biosynthesis protein ThiS